MSDDAARSEGNMDEATSDPEMDDGEVHRATREVTGRAIRRLAVLEVVFTVAAAGLSLVAGALVAYVTREPFGWPFRSTWIVASIVLFSIPAAIVWVRERRD